MKLGRIAENWNGQVTRLYNWTIKRLESAADEGDEKTAPVDYQQASVNPRRYASEVERHEIRH